ncbi:MAG: histidine kinase dimerization/phospho-acceptor domain-containing protein [Enterocloster sp.]
MLLCGTARHASHFVLADQAYPSADAGPPSAWRPGIITTGARKVSDDELGQLTADFNQMANALEDNINQLEDEIQAREDFVAAFAHELKTPLTSIIGYADALRSRRLDEEKQFMSANYIYTEGKRLEAMSFRPVGHHGYAGRQEVEFHRWCPPNPCFSTCMTCT